MKQRGEDKDIVKKIVESLRNPPVFPYKEGAWERFKEIDSYPTKTSSKYIYIKWASIAAAMVLCIGLVLYSLQDTSFKKAEEKQKKFPDREWTSIDQSGAQKENKINAGKLEKEDTAEEYEESLPSSIEKEPQKIADVSKTTPVEIEGTKHKQHSISLSSNELYSHEFTVNEEALQNFSIDKLLLRPTATKLSTPMSSIPPLTLAMQSYAQTQVQTGKDPIANGGAEYSFSDRLYIGAYVSPTRTEDKMNFGGGLLLGFTIVPKLTIRTGLGFNQYEVSRLKNPDVSKETGKLSDAHQITKTGFEKSASLNGSAISNREVMIPNVNSVSAQVQSLEIPLEVQYDIGQGFYATTGASYAKAIRQKRYAHYQEIDRLTLQGTSQEIRRVDKTVESSEKNISNHGFGGFVNLSAGKKLSVGKKGLSLSVEPYFKIPIGGFRHTDLNYTNGGVRIITNFK